MDPYHKINSVYKRDPETRHKNFIIGEYSCPEFEFLKDLSWVWTEKIDGTNIRVIWDGESVSFEGRKENSQIPPFLLEKLREVFPAEKLAGLFEVSVCLYGEGYGSRIQKDGGRYIPDGCNFILFDVLINGLWLEGPNVKDIAEKLGIDCVPAVGCGTLGEAIETVRDGFKSLISADKELIAEGLIMVPSVNLLDRRGNRIITKVKHADFKQQPKKLEE